MIADLLLATLVLAPPRLECTTLWEAQGHESWGYFGGTVAFLGDVDGDGVFDVLVGAVEEERDETTSAEGVLHCLSGVDGHELYAVPGGHENERLGSGMAVLDDVSGDGCPDFVTFSRSGVSLRSGRDGAIVRLLLPFEPGLPWSWHVAACPDLDGDHLRDVLVAIGSLPAMCGTGEVNHPGRLLVCSSRDGAVLRRIEGPEDRSERFGLAAAVLPDRDGDSLPEFGVDSPFAGLTRIFSGLTGAVQLQLSSEGWSLAGGLLGTGDVNGDGTRDLLVAARENDPSRTAWSGLQLRSGSDGSLLRGWKVEGLSARAHLDPVELPDFDHDGVREIALADASFDSYHGRVQILSPRDARPLGRIVGPRPSTIFGSAIAAIDELGAGRGPALAIGAVGDDRGAEGGGALTLVLVHAPD